jgi:DME family drug/metabolite transporter
VVGFLRLGIGALTLLVLAPLFGGNLRQLPGLLLRPLVWVMAITSGTYQALFFAAVERAGVATAALVTVGCIPVMAGLVGWVAFRERPTWVWYLATAVAVTGLAVRSAGELQLNDATGLLLAVGAGSGIGGYLNAAKVEIRRGGHPMLLPGSAYLIGSACLFPLVRSDLATITWTPEAVLLCVYLGVISMGLANACQIIGLHGISPGVAATMMLADPVTAALLGVAVLHEPLTTVGALGLGLVVLGLLLQSLSPGERAESRRGRHRVA